MQTRREQVRAYRFVNRRMVSALLSGDPESQDLPMRRLGLAIFGSAMVAAIVFAGVGVYGIYNPGGGHLDDQSVVIERETGARYVYLNGTLMPVLNYTSAVLIVNSPSPRKATVSQATLRGYPRGPMVGIPDAPDSLPAPDALVRAKWSVCSAPRLSNGANTQLTIGGGHDDAIGLGERSLLVGTDRGQQYLLWHNHRLQIGDNRVLVALGVTAKPVTVSAAVLNGIDAGPTLAPPRPDGFGDPSDRHPGGRAAKIGDVFRSGGRYYVLLRDGMAPIGEATARLLRTGLNDEPPLISPDDVGIPSKVAVEAPGALTAIPTMVDAFDGYPDHTTVCATYDPARPGSPAAVGFYTYIRSDMPTSAVGAGGTVQHGVATAEQVVLAGGHGALVRAIPAPGAQANGTTIYLVTDEGVRYALGAGPPDPQAALGYADVTPVPIPAALLDLVPSGPALDQASAYKPVLRAPV